MQYDVHHGISQGIGIFAKVSDAQIASTAQEAAHRFSLMAVIDDKMPRLLFADGAYPTLNCEHLKEPRLGDPILPAPLCSRLLSCTYGVEESVLALRVAELGLFGAELLGAKLAVQECFCSSSLRSALRQNASTMALQVSLRVGALSLGNHGSHNSAASGSLSTTPGSIQ
jgi:hypothetical protein